MKRLLIALVALVACDGSQQYEVEPSAAHIQAGLSRAVAVSDGQFLDFTTCSGIILSSSQVLTAAHCVKSADGLKVNNNPAYVLCKDDKVDLALLLAYTGSKDYLPLSITDGAKIGDKVFVVADPSDIRIVTIGRVIRADEDMIMVGVITGPGSSGGALYNIDGQLIGIVNKMRSHGETILFGGAVPGKVIKKFLQ